MTRSEAILAAIAAELIEKNVNEATDLRKITFEVVLRSGGGSPRSVITTPEYERALGPTCMPSS